MTNEVYETNRRKENLAPDRDFLALLLGEKSKPQHPWRCDLLS